MALGLLPDADIHIQGEIYLKFDAVESAKNAIQGLNGRWFGGRQISANFISDAMADAIVAAK
jgi:RNA-binding protein 23/39